MGKAVDSVECVPSSGVYDEVSCFMILVNCPATRLVHSSALVTCHLSLVTAVHEPNVDVHIL